MAYAINTNATTPSMCLPRLVHQPLEAKKALEVPKALLE
jgi:hypothetical protein